MGGPREEDRPAALVYLGAVPSPSHARRIAAALLFVLATLAAAGGEARVPVSPEGRALQRQLRRCWARATTETTPPLPVRYEVVVVLRDGRVTTVDIEGPDVGDLKPGWRRALRRHPWPAADARVAFPLIFTRRVLAE